MVELFLACLIMAAGVCAALSVANGIKKPETKEEAQKDIKQSESAVGLMFAFGIAALLIILLLQEF